MMRYCLILLIPTWAVFGYVAMLGWLNKAVSYWVLGFTRRNAKISSQNRCAIGTSLLKASVDNYDVFLL